MKTILTLLIASTALTATIGLPAWNDIQSFAAADTRPIAATIEAIPDAAPVILASNDDDGGDDDDANDHRRSEPDQDECDDDDCRGGTRNPAAAGTVTPPQNGLFGNGAPPQIQVK